MSENTIDDREYMRRIVNLERCDYELVMQVAKQRGLGKRGFSAALRMIIREWQGMREAYSLPEFPTSPHYRITDT
jgi:hypothetical protein